VAAATATANTIGAILIVEDSRLPGYRLPGYPARTFKRSPMASTNARRHSITRCEFVESGTAPITVMLLLARIGEDDDGEEAARVWGFLCIHERSPQA
jgi:hypothetical protein